MACGLPLKFAQIDSQLGFSDCLARRCKYLGKAGGHGRLQRLYGRSVGPLVMGSSNHDSSKRGIVKDCSRRPAKFLVPSKGLEPPHPCGYMDLNHARLPIPPRWQKVIRYGATQSGRLQERTTANILQGHRSLSNVEVGLQASGFRL